jgi:pimeloyl-ACP methyl ester carboxylesterase
MAVAFSRLTIPTASQPMQVLCIDAPDTKPDSPVLLFLHGKGEFGPNLDSLPLVLRNMAPGYQAIQEQLKGVTVVSPQVPSESDVWTWSNFVPALTVLLKHYRDLGRTVVAAGFSRGGRGVLQLNAAEPGLISKWAIVDPQRAETEEEERLLPKGPNAEGWLRHGKAIAANTPFAEKVRKQLDPKHGVFADFKHGELAIKAFSGERLGGAQHIYEYLDVTSTFK